MKLIQLKIVVPKCASDLDSIVDDFEWYIHNLRNSGQILDYPFFPIIRTSSISVDVYCLDEKGLNPDNDTQYSEKWLVSLKNKGIRKVEMKVIGETFQRNDVCICRSRKAIVLYADWGSAGSSPFRCLKCFGQIPLFQLKTNRKEKNNHQDALSWARWYNACDKLQMGCTIGERFGTRQILHFDSQLSVLGRGIAKKYEQNNKVPVFYYLMKYYGKDSRAERERKCPSCKELFRKHTPTFSRFDFECNQCRLLSNIAMEIRSKMNEKKRGRRTSGSSGN